MTVNSISAAENSNFIVELQKDSLETEGGLLLILDVFDEEIFTIYLDKKNLMLQTLKFV